ncbi:exodeoxyribonuclease V alpha subunit [Ruminococcaceae bacterium YRB3002]|nr:exodeoxyribonuclease V alpha subunit [Ruminococcaceae bacterium YRB3002]
MKIDTTTRAISDVKPEDIGTHFDNVVITVRKIIFAKEGNNFQAFVCDGNLSCSANTPIRLAEGLSYRVSGTVTEYGSRPQLSIGTVEVIANDDFGRTVRVNFLLVFFEKNGITKRLADGIVKACGDDLLGTIHDRPYELALNVKGLSEGKAVSLSEQIEADGDVYKRYLDLMMIGLSARQAEKCNKRPDITPAMIRENPFVLAVLDGFTFADLENISKTHNVPPLDVHRVYSAIVQVLTKYHANTSSTYAEPSETVSEVKKLIGFGRLPRDVKESFDRAYLDALQLGKELGKVAVYRIADNRVSECLISDDGARIALRVYYRAERRIMKEIRSFVRARVVRPSEDELDRLVQAMVNENNITLDGCQVRAIKLCMYSPLCVITGGPGTGKTTIMGLLASHFERHHIDCVFAAPTGRAAKRLSDATGQDAYTIHRLLEAAADPSSESGFVFRRNHENPLKARVIVIDEMSMVDVLLFRSLLGAVGKGTSLILIGDPDQLPSVGCGNVLEDLLTCDAIPKVKLDVIHRQEDGSDIASNAYSILSGNDLVPGDDFHIINCATEQEAQAKLAELYDTLSGDDSDIMVLSPTKQNTTILGTPGLNTMLQSRCHTSEELAELQDTGYGRFLVGDRVMQMKNNYSLEYIDDVLDTEGEGVFNGEIGTVIEVDHESGSVSVRYEDGKIVTYGHDEIDNIELAYAVTVHKSQGCEFNDCIIVLGNINYLLKRRNLLYTAVTRGKSSVTIINVGDNLKGFLNSPVGTLRKTSLKDMLAIVDDAHQ